MSRLKASERSVVVHTSDMMQQTDTPHALCVCGHQLHSIRLQELPLTPRQRSSNSAAYSQISCCKHASGGAHHVSTVTKLLLLGLLLLLCFMMVNSSGVSGTTQVFQASVRMTELHDSGSGAEEVQCMLAALSGGQWFLINPVC